MKVTFVKFDNLLAEEKDEHIGILMEEKTVICLCCFGLFFEEDYIIHDKKEVEFETVDELLNYMMEVKNEEAII